MCTHTELYVCCTPPSSRTAPPAQLGMAEAGPTATGQAEEGQSHRDGVFLWPEAHRHRRQGQELCLSHAPVSVLLGAACEAASAAKGRSSDSSRQVCAFLSGG